METRFLRDRRVQGNEQRKELWGNGHVGDFAEKETLYVRGLGDLYGSDRRSTLDQGKRDLWLGRKTELAHQVCHAYTLSCMHVKKSTGVEAKRTHVPTALDLDTVFKAVACMRCIVEIVVIRDKAEPSLGVPCSCGLFNVAERDAGVVLAGSGYAPDAEEVARK